jgi:Xaa-Pro aminopeptidase
MNNISKIRSYLGLYKCDGIMITSPINRFYATDFNSSAGVFLVLETDAWFFTDTRYIEAAESKVTEAKIRTVTSEATYSSQIKTILDDNKIKSLGFEDDRLTYAEYLDLSEKLKIKMVPAGELFDDLRAVKSPEQLDKMIKSQRIAERTFEEILPIIGTDITEKQLANELVYRLIKNGADDKAFDPIVVTGAKTSMPHGEPGNEKIGFGFLTMDFGARLDGWCSDMTRTVCVGKPDDVMVNVYETVLKAQIAGIDAFHADVKGIDVDAAARAVIENAGYGEFFGHGFGHSIGLEVHESLKASKGSEDILPCGAVISAEPGIYLPGRFGVRIEDVVCITTEGCKNITLAKKDLIIL